MNGPMNTAPFQGRGLPSELLIHHSFHKYRRLLGGAGGVVLRSESWGPRLMEQMSFVDLQGRLLILFNSANLFKLGDFM